MMGTTLRVTIAALAGLMGANVVIGPTWAADWPTIQKRGYLKVAVADNAFPLAFRDEAGQLQGFEVDLARQLAQALLGKSEAVRFQVVRSRDRLQAVMDDRADLAIAQVTATASRRRVVEFSPPYYYNRTVLLTNQPDLSRLPQSTSLSIGVLPQSSAIALLKAQFPQSVVVELPSYAVGQDQLASGKIAVMALDFTTALAWLRQSPRDRILPDPLGRYPLGIAMPRGLQFAEFRNRVNQALQNLKQQGWVGDRLRHWGLEDPLSVTTIR
ncbi:transporter substrate-binding domain-containing protein [Alkalinema sp. FACHB-956]|uniref:transporter substrate-binding domain-containing protein n=1 Tax=Alkalinema sp. FACHB-956 TaxID=2692768 RepID=UPI001688C476|nr:transporter substrate-binding domain-containing protein [Alkalinema sp. FACHB-956]MBD2328312.1 transporter substrate-binding domain-containing protein [Alkalinema sp. FACHB-956]